MPRTFKSRRYKIEDTALGKAYEELLTKKKPRNRLKRPCKRCETMFEPCGRFCWICYNCRTKR